MSKTKAGSVAADRLKSFIERIENLREEKKAIGSDERDVFSEAKGVGFDAKAMREVLRRRAMDASDRDEWDTLIDTYEHALGARGEAARIVASGGTYDEAAAKTGVGRATVARTVAGIKNLENETPATPHNPETGVIIEVPAASRSDASNEGDSERRSDPVGCDGADTNSNAAPQTLGDASAPVAEPVHSSACPPQPLSEGGDGIGHQIVCIVDCGDPCPETCALEGRCVWASKEVAASGGASLPRRPVDSGVTFLVHGSRGSAILQRHPTRPADDHDSAHECAAQPNVCSTEPVPMKPEVGAVAEPSAATWQKIVAGRDAFETEREAAREAERARRRAEHKKVADWNAVIDADPLTIPPFLRKQVAASVT